MKSTVHCADNGVRSFMPCEPALVHAASPASLEFVRYRFDRVQQSVASDAGLAGVGRDVASNHGLRQFLRKLAAVFYRERASGDRDAEVIEQSRSLAPPFLAVEFGGSLDEHGASF